MLIIGCDFHTRYQQIAMAGGSPFTKPPTIDPQRTPGWPMLAGLQAWRCLSLASPKGGEDSFPFHSHADTALTFLGFILEFYLIYLTL
jgi:hypothetical protein